MLRLIKRRRMFRDDKKNKVRKREKQADRFVNHSDQLWSHKVSSVTAEQLRCWIQNTKVEANYERSQKTKANTGVSVLLEMLKITMETKLDQISEMCVCLCV